jgi:L-asparaginase/Glu-tRNA(Gln) amidotransferase subunit D
MAFCLLRIDCSFFDFIRLAISNGVEVVVSSQCLRGSVELGRFDI